MRTRLTTAAITAFTLVTTLSLNAQTPQNPPPQPQPQPQTERQRPVTDPPARANSTQAVMVQGCLSEGKDMPGRSPNAADRAGVNQNYVLTNVKMAQGSATSGLGLAATYQVKGVANEELKKHVGHQVEIMATLSASAATPGADASGQRGTTAASSDALPDLQASSIKMLSQTCAAQ